MKPDTVYSTQTPIVNWKAFIDTHCLTKVGAFNNRCTLASWWNGNKLYTLDQLYRETAWCSSGSSIAKRLYLVYHTMTAEPLCAHCQQQIPDFQQFKSGYRQYCSTDCSTHSKLRSKKIQATTNARYGTDRKAITDAMSATNQQRYGVSCTFQEAVTKIKSGATKLARYGSATYNNTDQRMKTNMTRYGVEHTTLDPEIQAKMRDSMYKNHEDKWISQAHLSDEVVAALRDVPALIARNQQGESIQQIAESLGVTYRTIYLKFQQAQIDPIFYSPSPTTKPHLAIAEYVASLGFVPVLNDRTQIKPKELDIYIPEKHFAIELHGMYWHSFDHLETTEERQRHATKYLLCEQQGIRLLQLWDEEWYNKPAICKSIIRRALGCTPQSLGARKTVVVYPTLSETRAFLEQHHMSGMVPYQHAIGLAHNHELLMVMTFTKSRFTAHDTWELTRMATHGDWAVIGGAEKLWAGAQPWIGGDSVGTYSDNRLFTGNTFQALGFVHHHTTPPGYLYTDKQGRPHARWHFQKHKLVDVLPIVDMRLTEAENMFTAGYRRLWDAGHKYWRKVATTN